MVRCASRSTRGISRNRSISTTASHWAFGLDVPMTQWVWGRAPDWAPEAFGVRPGSVCGVVERRGWDQDDRVVEFSRTWFDPDRVRYVSRLR